ncbi:MAG: TRAP transporter small permease [Confluentimicrobium sp.]|uniref:TRAP transporter small permease protein n=1 Tax=Actibacterium naphthalenivorans TaxID=1614693 RepID=A0A840CED8_9RHOB|nr:MULTISPECIES: TRAP transporter small permease [Actibacterium]ALG90629.1 C4-dicarboxylate ABC transporter substrate-binding protein [Actibacterium sp. EMB200-NS6]MBB4023193.1 C4-dicarboxylate transporter DctQ subunit [Actibacterium naphthalenivorans]MBC57297.1 TRAP transporter small permease [Actibacterium sp.]
MSGHTHTYAQSSLGRAVNTLEETALALILGLMTLVTFVNVVLRYGFNTSLIWGLELTLVLFAWLVLFGISYGFKITAHLGVDAVLNMVSSRTRRIMILLTTVACLIYALLLLKGAWDYWAPFAGLDATTGRWFPTGFANSRDQAWYETEQIPMLDWLRFIEPVFNQGEAYEKLPRFIPYSILPFGAALILFRLIQATLRILRGTQDSLIVSHEAEDAVDEAAAMSRKG